QERLLYRCAVDNFWELDSVTEREVIGRHSPLTSNAPQRLELQALKAGSQGRISSAGPPSGDGSGCARRSLLQRCHSLSGS
ncbi:hypothetical protein ACV344_34635, partial [Pseudomonas aeruginosa]